MDATGDASASPRKLLDTTTEAGDAAPHTISTPSSTAEPGEEVSVLRRSGRIRHPPNRLDL